MKASQEVSFFRLETFVPDRIWLYSYPIRFFAMNISARTTIVRLAGGGLWVHSPGPIPGELGAAIDTLGPVRYLVAPGNFHYLHVADFQARYPEARTFICPGVEKKAPGLAMDHTLGDTPPAEWAEEIDQVHVRGAKLITEVAFFDRPSRTLILTDLLENIGDGTPGIDWKLKLWWKVVFHMWNRPGPAPEYRVGRGDKELVRGALARILEWDFERIVIAHGDLVSAEAKAVARKAWAGALGGG